MYQNIGGKKEWLELKALWRPAKKKVLKAAKGYYGNKHRLFKTAKQAVMKRRPVRLHQRKQKRDFRQNVDHPYLCCRKANSMNYSTFMNGLKKAGVDLNRKMLSEIAIADPSEASTALTGTAKAAL